jgi:hypothetical protein
MALQGMALVGWTGWGDFGECDGVGVVRYSS